MLIVIEMTVKQVAYYFTFCLLANIFDFYFPNKDFLNQADNKTICFSVATLHATVVGLTCSNMMKD